MPPYTLAPQRRASDQAEPSLTLPTSARQPKTVVVPARSGTANVAIAFVAFVAIFTTLFAQDMSSTKKGLLGVICAFFLFSMLYFPDGAFVRPHRAFWRLWLAIGVVYLSVMVFFCFLEPSTIKWVVGLYDPTANIPLPEREYASDCRISTAEDPYKFFWTVFDIFLVAHTFGTCAKMLMIRNWKVITFLSLMFEVIEVSAQHLLPNFKECWWDHVIVDVSVCNALGTLLGYVILKYVKDPPELSFLLPKAIRPLAVKMSAITNKVLPNDQHAQYQWSVDTFKHFAGTVFLCTVMLVQETNVFTTKTLLNLPPHHHLVIGRQLLYAFFGLAGLRQLHDFFYDPKCKEVGPMAWLLGFGLFFETAWVAKMTVEGGYFRNPWSAHIVLPLFYTAGAFTLWVVLHFGFPKRRSESEGWRYFLNCLLYSCPLALLALCCMGNVDLKWGQVAFDDWASQLGLWH